jgi:hypothetical protein
MHRDGPLTADATDLERLRGSSVALSVSSYADGVHPYRSLSPPPSASWSDRAPRSRTHIFVVYFAVVVLGHAVHHRSPIVAIAVSSLVMVLAGYSLVELLRKR